MIFAKLGSDYKKPDATTVITEENFRSIVWPLPCSDLLFVGRSTEKSLNKINVKTIGDLASCDRDFLVRYIGKNGGDLWRNANGLDDSEVKSTDYRRVVKSVGNSTTASEDMSNPREISKVYHSLCSSVASRLRKHGLKGSVIKISVRDKELNVYEKQKMLFKSTDNEDEIYEAAMELFRNSYDWHSSVRSIGVRVADLSSGDAPEQLSIFDDQAGIEKAKTLDRTIDLIRGRFGSESLKRAAQLNDRKTDDE